MLKDLNGRVVPHPTEYIVMIGDCVSPLSRSISYTRVATFVHKQHALEFAKTFTAFHTAVIDPEINSNLELIGYHVLDVEGWLE